MRPAFNVRLILPLGCLVLVALALVFGLSFRGYYAHLSMLDDSETYTPKFSTVLGSEWQASIHPIHDHSNNIGFDWGIAGSTEWRFSNIRNRLSFITYRVIAYVDDANATRDYQEQKTIFTDFTSQYPWEPFDLPQASEARALRCKQIPDSEKIRDIECVGLFRYGRRVVYLNIFPRRNYTTYLTAEQITKIVAVIDSQFGSP